MVKNFSKGNERAYSLLQAFQSVCHRYSVPDVDFLVSLHDALDTEYEVPLFVMAKNIHKTQQILIPDFESVRGKYQVLKRRDITQNILPTWEEKKAQLIWRGTSAQTPSKHLPTILGDSRCFSRVKLCELSHQFPHFIDAKITRFVDGWKKLRGLEHVKGNFLPYEEMIKFKYQMLIDGYTCSYTHSGWRWFTGCLIFKEESENVQWYYSALRPYEHFIPVKAGLEDLVDRIEWARSHDAEAKEIAAHGRKFALENLTQDKDLIYLYHVFLAYSKLAFVD